MKEGFTTGTCAQAAAKGATLMLITRAMAKIAEVETASGERFVLKLADQKIGKGFASCAIVKDAGDDPDITHGAKICAMVRFSQKKGVTLTPGKGIGRVTKPGLAVGVGEYAINPVPRKMIIKEVAQYLPKDKGLEVVISVPEGKRLARHTFNPRLGVIGGISILGTTGVVRPKSQDAYKVSLSLQLDVLKAQGRKDAVLVLGYVGERFCKEKLKLSSDSIIKIGDHVGFMLKECAKKGIKDVLLIGHVGKMVKIANGQFNTHFKFGDNRIETIVRFAKSCGADKEVIETLLKQTTAEATIEILRKNGLMPAFDKIARTITVSIDKFLDKRLSISCIILSLKGEILAKI